jgi:methylase of polypeptide subunit release factors
MKLDIAAVSAFHREMHGKFRATETGMFVEYLGKKFVVHKNVFWPGDDSRALVENYVVHPGEEVLDLCTGAGPIAIFSADKGARSVLALDKSSYAVENARHNAELNGYSGLIEARESDMFSAVEPDRRFDVITMNPPFMDHELDDIVSNSTWDQGLYVHKEFFAHAKDYLKPNGRGYIAQANFGPIKEIKQMVRSGGYAVREIGKYKKPNTQLVFYAFELRPR